jgi:heat shock protein HslJ
MSSRTRSFPAWANGLHFLWLGGWLVLVATSSTSAVQPGEPSRPHRELEELAWLVGRWTSTDEAAAFVMDGAWADGENFLFIDSVAGGDGAARETSSTRIAWDGIDRTFRSWTFQPDGSFAEGRWSADKGAWKIANRGVSSTGQLIAEEILLRPESPGRMTVAITRRKRGDEDLPDIRLDLRQGGNDSAETMPGLEKITWELYELRGVPMEFDRPLTVQFEDGNLQAFGGVNRMAGSFELAEGRLKVGPLRATRMAGPPELMELEQTYADMLAAANGCQIENRELNLLDGGEVIARFREGR